MLLAQVTRRALSEVATASGGGRASTVEIRAL
jgi:hypothetical protein